MREFIATLVAGLGIFFLGAELVAGGLQASGSRRLRGLIRGSAKTRPRCAVLGLASGLVMQGNGAVASVLGSMAATGMITVHQALPILAFANIGTSALVFLGALDIHLAVLYGVGLFGMAYALATDFRWKSAAAVALGLGLLLYGSGLVTAGSAGIVGSEGFRNVVASARGLGLLAFGLGTLASFISQSSSAIALVTVALAGSGALPLPEAMMMTYGANLGSTLMRMLLSRGRSGLGRQIAGFQDLFRLAGSAIFLGLHALEFGAGIPLVGTLLGSLTPRLPLQVALLNLLLNSAMVLLAGAVGGPLERLLARRWPPHAAEDLSAPKYIDHEALDDPETAVDLLEREQQRVVGHLRDHLGPLREGSGREGPERDSSGLHQSFLALSLDIEHFYTAIVARHLAAETSERLGNLHGRLNLVWLVEDSLHQLTGALRELPADGRLGGLRGQFVEALDLLLLLAGDAAHSRDREDVRMLQGLCSDRSEMMGRLRSLHLAPEQALPPAERALLLTLTTHFERMVWMLGRYARLLEQAIERP